MPRISKKATLEKVLVEAAHDLNIAMLLDSEPDSSDDEFIEDLLIIYECVSSSRYLQPRTVKNWNSDILEGHIQNQSNGEFLSMFRMHRDSFWKLATRLEEAGGKDYWRQRPSIGNLPRPIYQQIAVAIYVLGGGAGGAERERRMLNIGRGTVNSYLWRTIDCLNDLMKCYVQWPSSKQRKQQYNRHELFTECVGFIGSSEVVLRDKPRINPETYLSRENVYGFNLQVICDWDYVIIYTEMERIAKLDHIASVHNLEASKSARFLRHPSDLIASNEYLIGDKSYQLDRYILTPYKEPTSHQPQHKEYNRAHLSARKKIERPIGLLKARWRSLNNLPLRIADVEKDNDRANKWVLACITLHNFLRTVDDNDEWLTNEMEDVIRNERENSNPITNVEEGNDEMVRAGVRKRNLLRLEI